MKIPIKNILYYIIISRSLRCIYTYIHTYIQIHSKKLEYHFKVA